MRKYKKHNYKYFISFTSTKDGIDHVGRVMMDLKRELRKSRDIEGVEIFLCKRFKLEQVTIVNFKLI